MTNSISDISLRKAAIVAGFGYLTMTILAPFAEIYNVSNNKSGT